MVAGMSNYDKAGDSLRRLGAKVHATNITASCLLRWCISKAGYDLVKAGGGLIGLSNSLADNPTDAFRAIHTNSIQVVMKLPRDYNDESLRLLKEAWDQRHGGEILEFRTAAEGRRCTSSSWNEEIVTRASSSASMAV